MSVRGTLGGVFAAAAVLIVGWQAGVSATGPATAAADTTTGTPAAPTGSAPNVVTPAPAPTPTPSVTPTTTPAVPAASTSGLVDGTFTGATEETRFGPVQVSVTISSGQVTEVTPLQLTNDSSRSEQISNRAAPVLRDQVIAGQSADVSYVSGATYTSEAYLASVQSALDQARG